MVAIANHHVLDYGYDVLSQLLEFLNRIVFATSAITMFWSLVVTSMWSFRPEMTQSLA